MPRPIAAAERGPRQATQERQQSNKYQTIEGGSRNGDVDDKIAKLLGAREVEAQRNRTPQVLYPGMPTPDQNRDHINLGNQKEWDSKPTALITGDQTVPVTEQTRYQHKADGSVVSSDLFVARDLELEKGLGTGVVITEDGDRVPIVFDPTTVS